MRAAAGVVSAPKDRSNATASERSAAKLVAGSTAAALEELRRVAPESNRAESWSDLSAAFIASASESRNPALLVDALAAADNALRASSQYAPALFNRALVLERLGVRRLARRAWTEYVWVEQDPQWANEGLHRLNRIGVLNEEAEWRRMFVRLRSLEGSTRDREAAAAVHRYPQHARRWGENVVIGDWAEATLAHDRSKARRELELARQIGRAIERGTGDSMLRQIVDGIVAAAANGQDRSLASAMLMYRAGRLAHSANRAAEAEAKLRLAEARLARHRSPLALAARYYVASALDAQWRVKDAADAFEAC